MLTHPTILIVDMGSQLTLVIARILRESRHRSVVLSPAKAGKWMATNSTKAVIISGSDKGVHDKKAPSPPENVVGAGVPILGICYGMQWLANHFGGAVANDHDHVEYGPAKITVLDNSNLFDDIEQEQNVWASHGDSVLQLPDGFSVIATSNGDEGSIRAMAHEERKVWGVQFHPEVEQTECGEQLLRNFVQKICGCIPDWEPTNVVAEIREEIGTMLPVRAILGFSGGVDSTTMATILSPVLDKQLLGVCIDGGHLREMEIEEIRKHASAAGIRLEVINAKEVFLENLEGITDAEEKRHAFKRIYLQLLTKAAKDFGATHMVQGTLATDLIESGATGGDLIKSHHNVDLDWGDLQELRPLSHLFKYEVRALADELELPDSVVNREPFPGPGLFLRVFGGEVMSDRLDLVRWATHEVHKIVGQADDVPEISQLVVALCCVDTTGVKGDGRAYGPAIVIRAVQTSDFMTAKAVEFPVEIRRAVSAALTRHAGIVRVWWDEVPKPPATTEFE